MHISQIITIVLACIYCIGCLILFILQYKRFTENSLHSMLALFAVCLIGIALLLYRLLRGTCTRVVKYYHMLVNSFAIILFIAAIILIKNNNDYKISVTLHGLPGFFTFVALIVQYVVAIFVFTYLYENQRLRLYYAPFHDIIGIWVFICLVGVILVAVNNARMPNYTKHNIELYIGIFNGVALITFLVVAFVVLCPYFEWELEGLI